MHSDLRLPTVLQARHATKWYPNKTGKVLGVNDINLAIKEGEFVIVIGPSGSGKSTLINLLSGIDVADEGEVYYRGRELSACSDRQRTHIRRRSVTVVFQSFELISLMSCYRNIEFPLLLAGLRRSERQRRVKAVGDMLDIGDLLGRRINAISVGQRQRVAIGRALAVEPDVVLGDEITSSLDSRTSRRIYALLREQQRESGRTFVLVTHDASLVEPGDRVFELCDGKVQERAPAGHDAR